jgi:hypothetical protein
MCSCCTYSGSTRQQTNANTGLRQAGKEHRTPLLYHNSVIYCFLPALPACVLQALQGLECPAVEKQESAWPACRDVLARGAVLYQQLDFVAAALMERARKHEHMPKLAALIAKYAEEKCSSTQLVRKLLQSCTHACCSTGCFKQQPQLGR